MKVAYVVCVILVVCVHKIRTGLVKEVPTVGSSQQGYGQNFINGIPQYTQYANIAGNNIGQGLPGQQYGPINPFLNRIAENVAREIQKAQEVANNINRNIFQSVNRYNGYYNNYFNNYYNQLNRTLHNGHSVPQYGNYVPQNGVSIYNNHQTVVEKSTTIYPNVIQNNNTPRADGIGGNNNYNNHTVIVEKTTTIYPKVTENNNTPRTVTDYTKTVTDIPKNVYDCNNPPIDIRIENSNDGGVTCIVENDDTSTKLTANKDKTVEIMTNNNYSTNGVRVDIQSITKAKTVTNETQVPSAKSLSTTTKSHIEGEVTINPQDTTTYKAQSEPTDFVFRDEDEIDNDQTSTEQRSLVNVTPSKEPCVPPLIRDPKSGSCVPDRDNFNGGCPSGQLRSSDDTCQDVV